MSVRIYELSKELNMENKEVMQLLRDRGFEVKSASSTIDNISAQALVEEFGNSPDSQPSEEAAAPKAEQEEAPKPGPVVPKLPPQAIVKTREEIEKERREKEAAEGEARAKREAEREAARRAVVEQQQKPQSVVKAPDESEQRKSPPLPPPPSARRSPMPAPQITAPGRAAPSMVPPRPAAPAGSVPPPVKIPSARPAATPSIPPAIPKPVGAGATPPQGGANALAGKIIEEDGKKIIQLKPPIVVRDFAQLLGQKPFQLISELNDMGIFASLNLAIEEPTAKLIAERHGFELDIKHRGDDKPEKKKKKEQPRDDDPALMEERPPVVCVLGHVDHGKTSLLDRIRKANVVSGEAGGITQHIGAYQVPCNDKKITFLDTPGHAAFSKMRERGANVTDIAILVVAADDGFMPQTDEALKFARKANVELVIAINKMDAKGANIDRVKQQLQERDLMPEDWGGETLCTPVSALEGTNIEELLELVLLQAEVSELKANPKASAEGMVIESQVEQGRGPTATIIVQKGTLKVGDALVCGPHYCKVRAMMDEHGKQVKAAPPSTPVRLMGWSGAPESGSTFKIAKNEKAAKREAEENADALKKVVAPAATAGGATDLDSLLAAIDEQSSKVLRVIIKGDVHGSVEALQGCLEAIKSDKVGLEIIGTGVGQITKNDISMADSGEAAVVGFNVKQENGVSAFAKHHDVHVIQHNIIYELIEQVEAAMAELLDPEFREVKLGRAEVRAIFPLAKSQVAGCMVTEGIIKRDAHARVLRKDEVIYEGRIGTLKRFKDDATEVRAGYECGIQVTGSNDYIEGDQIECYEIHEFRPSLR